MAMRFSFDLALGVEAGDQLSPVDITSKHLGKVDAKDKRLARCGKCQACTSQASPPRPAASSTLCP